LLALGSLGKTGVDWRPMTPLPDQVSVLLRSSPTAAMAALLLISTSHRGLLDWFSRTVAPEPQPQAKPNANGVVRRGRKANGGGRKPGAYLERRRSRRDADDSALLAAMKASPGATIGDWSEAIHKSRTSTIAGLKRLRDRNLASNEDGIWALVEPREPPAKWVAPVSAREHRAHAVA
jgi:hypothetical protein